MNWNVGTLNRLTRLFIDKKHSTKLTTENYEIGHVKDSRHPESNFMNQLPGFIESSKNSK